LKIFYTRHGETEWNAKNIVCGITDIPLSEKGLEQAKALSEAVLCTEIDMIISSPMQRALTTANIVSKRIEKSVTIDKRLTEWNYGNYEGLDRSSDAYQQFQNGKHEFGVRLGKSGESLLQLSHRVYTALDEIISTYPGKNILLVCHGGVCRVIETYFSDVTVDEFDHYFFKNCELRCYDIKEKDGSL
jgi:probable phosphoglycerate mutase